MLTRLLSLLLLGALILPLAQAGGGHDDAAAEAPADHDAADEGIRSPDLQPGESFSMTFATPQQFDYHCHPHPWMLAAIKVVASSGRAPVNHTIEILEPIGEGFENWTWSPAVTTIEAGDTVTWVNRGSVMHVVQQTVGEHVEHVGLAGGSAGAGPGEAGHVETAAASWLPTQGWGWILVALIGGVLIGRRLQPKAPTKVQAAAGAEALTPPTGPQDSPKPK